MQLGLCRKRHARLALFIPQQSLCKFLPWPRLFSVFFHLSVSSYRSTEQPSSSNSLVETMPLGPAPMTATFMGLPWPGSALGASHLHGVHLKRM